jgi:uncharacterized protein
MVVEVESSLAEIAQACRHFQVERLEIFGSAARGATTFRDVDFVVRFADTDKPGYADRYVEFAEALERILGRPVDLVTERSLRNSIFESAIRPDRRTVYAA